MVDLFQLLIGIGTPLAILGINDAIYREYFDKTYGGEDVTTTAQRIILASSTVVFCGLIVFQKSVASLFFQNQEYTWIVVLGAFGIWFNANRMTARIPTKIQNKTRLFALSGIFESLGYYLLALFLVLSGRYYDGLMYARIIVSLVLVGVFYWLNRDFFKGKARVSIGKALLHIGIPTLPTLLIYWLYQSMDRIMIMNLLGPAELGVYAIGARMGQISLLIYAAFSGGWQYFAYSSMHESDYKDMMGRLWEILFVLSSCFYIIVFYAKDLLFTLLFEGEYERGVVVFPYLLLAPLILMLFQVLSTQLNVSRKTYLTPVILSVGAVLNVVLNLWLIPIWGIEGAALATIVGYIASLLLALAIVAGGKRLIHLKKQGIFLLVLYLGLFALMNTKSGLMIHAGTLLYLALCIYLYGSTVLKYGRKLLLRKGSGEDVE